MSARRASASARSALSVCASSGFASRLRKTRFGIEIQASSLHSRGLSCSTVGGAGRCRRRNAGTAEVDGRGRGRDRQIGIARDDGRAEPDDGGACQHELADLLAPLGRVELTGWTALIRSGAVGPCPVRTGPVRPRPIRPRSVRTRPIGPSAVRPGAVGPRPVRPVRDRLLELLAPLRLANPTRLWTRLLPSQRSPSLRACRAGYNRARRATLRSSARVR